MPFKIVEPSSKDTDIIEMKVHTWLSSQLKKRYPDAWYYKAPSGRYGRKGVPDFLISINSCFVAIEVKRIKGELTLYQREELRKIDKSGGLAITLFGRNLKVFDLIDKFVRLM